MATHDPLLERALLLESAVDQAGALHRRQLSAAGVDCEAVGRQVRHLRWQLVGPLVVVVHNGPLLPDTLTWAAALTAAPGGVVASWSALAQWGLTGWPRPGVHVVVARGCRPPPTPSLVVHESRRHRPEDVTTRNGLPIHRVERAAVDAAAWSSSARSAAGLMAAVVQQGLSTTVRIGEVLAEAGKVRHRRVIAATLDDVAGGARALSEIDLARLCRRAGLPQPVRQSRRRDPQGRWRYLDAVWRLARGGQLLVEIDGVGHLQVEQWYDDLMRAAEVADPGERVVRLPAMAARLEPERVVAVLTRLLVGSPGTVRATTRPSTVMF